VGKYEDIEKRVGGDPFRVGRNASAFLRTLRVNIDLWDLEYPGEYDVSHQIGRQRDIVDPLLKIEKKAGFRLTIELHQKRIRLNLLEQVFPDLRTILQAFEKERANVRILFVYRYNNEEYDENNENDESDESDDENDNGAAKYITPIESWELNDAIKNPESGWKDKLIAFLDSVSNYTRYQHVTNSAIARRY
jgi:hypothetical protein